MLNLLKKLYPLRLAPVSSDTDRAVGILQRELPFTIHEYQSGSEFNGWTVPFKWDVKKAIIRKGGKVIYDGKKHPLGVIGYSSSFEGKVSKDVLKKHLYYNPSLPDALVYHCDYYYKPHLRDWGFSVPYTFYESLPDGMYEVSLETSFEQGTMKVLDYELPGSTRETIILNAHNCHAGQANDDISGIVVAIEIIRRLSKRKERKYTYRIVIAPEHLGTVFYLAGFQETSLKELKYAIFLEMLGNNNRFAFQESFTGKSLLDMATHHYLRHNVGDFFTDRFRKIIGNDETVWEAPGYEIPCISLSRWPYPEYHSDKDDETIIHAEKLEEAVNVVIGIIDIIETDMKIQRHFNGLIALSNPKYDLYIPTFDPSLRPTVPDDQLKWNYLMNCLPRYFDSNHSLLEIAILHDIDYFQLHAYIKKFEEKGLISLIK